MESRVDNQNIQSIPTEDEIERDALTRDSTFKKLFPVSRREFSRIFSGSCIVFLVVLTYSMLKALKNASAASTIDPSAIPYIKSFMVLPTNIIAVTLTQKMVAFYGVSKTYDFVLISFGLFFVGYGIIFTFYKFNFGIDPNLTVDVFHDDRMKVLGFNFMYTIFGIINYPSVCLYYTATELYGSLCLSYLFWSFSNEFLTQKQALRISPIFIMFANIGLTLSGQLMGFYSTYMDESSYTANLYISTGFMLLCSFLCYVILIFKRYFENTILTTPCFIISRNESPRTPKKKISFAEAIKIAFSSKLVVSISLTVLAYGIAVNIFDNYYYRILNENALVKMVDPKNYTSRMDSRVQTATGILVILFLFVPSASIIRSGYIFPYAIVPTLISLLGTFFLVGLCLLNLLGSDGEGIFGGAEKSMRAETFSAIILGTAMRIVKFVSFDLTKEALSMKIDPKYRAVFKGVYDGHFGKLGKSGGSIYCIFCNLLFGQDIRSSSVITFPFLIVLTFMWLFVVIYLSKEYNKSLKENTNIEIGWVGGKPVY